MTDTTWAYLGPKFCINIPERQDRRASVVEEFERVGLLDQIIFRDGVLHKDGRFGLSMALYDIFTLANGLNLDRITIFEDDVRFINDPIRKFKLAQCDLKYSFGDKFDMLYLGANKTEPCLSVSSNIKVLHNALAAHAVCYKHTLYKSILKHLTRVIRQGQIETDEDIWDVFLTRLQAKYRAFMVHPMICTQAPGYSDIEKTDVDYSFMQKSLY